MPLEPKEVGVFNAHTSQHHRVKTAIVVVVCFIVLVGVYFLAKSLLTYTITYVPNGGSVFGEELEPDTYSFLELTVEPEGLRKMGFYLEGWYKDEACTKKFTFGKPIWRSRKLYAKWLPGCALVLNYASDEEEEKSGIPLEELRYYYQEYVMPNSGSSLPTVFNYKDGYHKGEQLLWFESPDCIGEPIETKEYLSLNEDINVYGKWYDTQEDKFRVDKDGVLQEYLGYCNRIILPNGIKEIKSILPDEFMGGNLNDQQGNQQSNNFSAFKNVLSTLEIIYINEDMTKFGSCAFRGCTALENIVFNGDNLESIGENAFQSCKSLTSIEIPTKVTTIPKKCFDSCTSLKKVTLTDNVTTIAEQAFITCSGLNTISLPGVKFIGKKAFVGCVNLISMYWGSEDEITTDATEYDNVFDVSAKILDGEFVVYVRSQQLVDYYNATSPWNYKYGGEQNGEKLIFAVIEEN